jgi:GNAT superfamily N-acetyltransferase
VTDEFEIRFLPPEKWRGYRFDMSYTSPGRYAAKITSERGLFAASFVFEPCEQFPVAPDEDENGLYADWWEGAQAFGLFCGGYDAPAGIIEVWPEEWSNRLLVTEMWFDAAHRRRGFGTALILMARHFTAPCMGLHLSGYTGVSLRPGMSQQLTYAGLHSGISRRRQGKNA